MRYRTKQLPFIANALALVLLAGQGWPVHASRTIIAPVSDSVQGASTADWSASTASGWGQAAALGEAPLSFDRITTADGLSFPIVRDILQDRQGFLWVATDSGLNRYDGYGFTVYRNNPGDPASMRFDDVRVLYEDSDGTLWIGGGGGLDRFDRTSETFTHVDTRGQVLSICEDVNGTLWVGFWHGLYGYDRTTNQIILADQPNRDAPADWSMRDESTVNAIHQDPGGDLWVGTGKGLFRRDLATGAFSSYRHDPQDPASLSSDNVTALHVDRQGSLWVGTNEGLNQFDRSTGGFVRFQHDPEDSSSLADSVVLSILEDREGTLWLGTMAGLDRFDEGQRSFLHYRHDPEDSASLGADVVLSIVEDRSGILWVGTVDGISKASRRGGQFARYRAQRELPTEGSYSLDVSSQLQEREPAILSDGRILAVEEDASGVLWIGTFSGGLNRLDREAGLLTVYRHDPDDPASLRSDRISAAFAGSGGTLWVGTRDGWLERLDPQTGAFTHARQFGAEVSDIAEDRTGDLWIATLGEGLYRLDSSRPVLTHYVQFWRDPDNWWREGTLSSQIVSTLYVDEDGTLWAGTVYAGINLWGEVNDRFTHLRHDPDDPNSLSHDQVLSIFGDPLHGEIWVGTGGGGLNRYSQAAESFRHYGEADGLPGNTVGCILADDAGYLWLATIKGLSRFDPDSETFRSYGQCDGVGILTAGAAGLGGCLRSQTGELLFGGSDGLYAFRPEEIGENLHPPPVAITAVKIHNETAHRALSTDQQIDLPYYDNFVSFEFAALDYTVPEKNQYAYRLEGLDREWVYAGTRRYANYPALRPGRYVFRVKGSNSDGVWSEDGTAVRIIIASPFWQTWAFRVIVAAVLLLLAVGIYRQRVQNIKARSKELERQVELRTREIIELSGKAQELAVLQERQRLARDLHDAVSQTLFSASLMAEALPELWKADPEEGRLFLVRLQRLNRGALAEMRALLMELRPAALLEASIKDLLRQLGQAVSGREGIPVTVRVDESCQSDTLVLPPEVRVAMYRIAQEALNNVVKHAQASQVDVSLSCTTGPHGLRAELRIRDDGLGFDPDSSAPAHLGLGIMRERAASIGAGFSIQSEPGWGTQVTVLWSGQGAEPHG